MAVLAKDLMVSQVDLDMSGKGSKVRSNKRREVFNVPEIYEIRFYLRYMQPNIGQGCASLSSGGSHDKEPNLKPRAGLDVHP